MECLRIVDQAQYLGIGYTNRNSSHIGKLNKIRMNVMSEKISISITQSENTTEYSLRKGLGLQALTRITDSIEYDCRAADCGICIVTVLDGMEQLSPPTPAEADFLKAMHAEENERLACQCRCFGDVKLKIEDFI